MTTKRNKGTQTTSVSCVTDPEFAVEFRKFLLEHDYKMGKFVREAIDEKIAKIRRKKKRSDSFFVNSGSYHEPLKSQEKP